MENVSAFPGRLFIMSFSGASPSDRCLRYIQDHHIGGIILFAEHCRDQQGLKSWLSDFRRNLDFPLLAAVDQEGGRVCRFAHAFPALESPREYGRLDRLDRYRDDLARVCERLHDIGVNMNLVPTVDLFDRGEDHVLDSRTFSDDPEVVARFARATVDIHHAFGLLTCAKHFPGLGRSQGDPHHVMSTSELDEAAFAKQELPPFRDIIRHGVDAVMVTHLVAPHIDTLPVIISKTMITGWLKEKLAFDGPVITDDLLMAGAQQAAPLPHTAEASFTAGADLLLFGREWDKAVQAFEAFAGEWMAGRLDAGRMADAGRRVAALTKKIGMPR